MIFYSQNIFIMTKTHLLVLICALFFNSALWACGFHSYRMHFCLFRPELLSNPDMYIFAENPSIGNDFSPCGIVEFLEEGKKADMQRNCQEWQRYLGKKVNEKDIKSILVDTNPTVFLAAYQQNQWKALENNSFIKELLNNKKAMDYMAIAKRAEIINAEPIDVWENNYPQINANRAITNQLLIFMQQCNGDAFLQERCAYHLIKAAYALQEYDNAIDYFRNCFDQKESIIKTWALLPVASAYYHTNQVNKCVLALSKVFEQSKGKRVRAYRILPPCNPNLVASLAKNKTEKASVYAFLELQNQGESLENLKRIIKLQPDNAYLPLLILREINKIENRLFSREIFGDMNSYIGADINAKNYPKKLSEYNQKDMAYLTKMRVFVENLSDQTLSPNFRHLVVGYLYLMENDWELAEQHIAQISGNAPKALLEQKKMMQAILLTHLRPIRDETMRQQLADLFKQIQKLKPKKITDATDREWSCVWQNENIDEFYQYISRQFQLKGDLVTAGLLLANQFNGYYFENEEENYYKEISFWDWYASPAHIDTILTIKHKKNKTDFEHFLTPRKWVNDYVYLDLKGTLAFRENDYTTAYQAFQKIPISFWQKNYEFKNYLNTPSLTHNTRFDIYDEDKQYPVDKTAWLKEAAKVQTALQTANGSEKAKLYFKMGNIAYNTSYYGESWMMFNYGWSVYDFGEVLTKPWQFTPSVSLNYIAGFYYDIPTNQRKYLNRYYDTKTAFEYYQKAYKLAGKDQETAAKACLMLHSCQRSSRNKKENAKSALNYLNTFSKRYKKTKAYKNIEQICPDLLYN